MISLNKILIIAHYEIKTLTRSRLFRVFAFLSIAVIIFLNIVFYVSFDTALWTLRCIPSSIPYMNLLVLNVIQGIIGIFVATEFLKTDKLHNFTESVYARSMTNADYILGKTLGIFTAFLVLNAGVLLISAVFNVVFTDDVPFILKSYLYYPIIINLPTLLYIFGLSFFLMIVVKSQALTILILLGYSILSYFFLGGNIHQLFDYSAFNLPLMYSDFIGFGNVGNILVQRGIYLLLGVGFIFSAVLMFKRPAQSKIMNRISLITATVCFISAVILGSTYISNSVSGKNLRIRMNILNHVTASKPRVSVTDCSLDLTHRGSDIEVDAHVTFENNTLSPIYTYIFSLNPGLEIQQITSNGNKLNFDRNLHIVAVKPLIPLQEGCIDSLIINYRGKINDEACYIDINEHERANPIRILLYNNAKMHSFVTSDFVLLTPENLWYPVSGIPYGSVYPESYEKDFVNFEIKIKTNENLTAISQGLSHYKGDGTFLFKPEHPLPMISLVIGEYEKKSIKVDDIDYSLYVMPGHDFFSQYFHELTGKLPERIREIKQIYERDMIVDYPYPRFSIIEVPVQFYSYERFWESMSENVQPEQIFFPEKGFFMEQADLKRNIYIKSRDKRNKFTMEELENEALRWFGRTFENDVLGKYSDSYRYKSARRRGMMKPNARRGFIIDDLIYDYGPMYIQDYNISPNYFHFTNHFSSDSYPIINHLLMHYQISIRMKELEAGPLRLDQGLTDEEIAARVLTKQSLGEILSDPADNYIASCALEIKSDLLLGFIEAQLGEDVFDEFLSEFLFENRFKTVNAEDFFELFEMTFGFSLEEYIDEWMNEKQLPKYLITDYSLSEVADKEKTKYQITFTAHNAEDVNGVISVSNVGPQSHRRFITLNGNQTKEIGMVFDFQPFGLVINNIVSQNIPLIFQKEVSQFKNEQRTEFFDGERVVDYPPIINIPGEIIVDNEDPGFEIITQPEESFFTKLVNKHKAEDEEYMGLNHLNIPSKWLNYTGNNNFYGVFVESAHFTKSGKGNLKVQWKTEIPESGKYDIYYHIPFTELDIVNSKEYKSYYDLNFIIHHDDGIDNLNLEIPNTNPGWTLLGTYTLSQGTSRIELTDKSKGKVVFADAVKWVKKD